MVQAGKWSANCWAEGVTAKWRLCVFVTQVASFRNVQTEASRFGWASTGLDWPAMSALVWQQVEVEEALLRIVSKGDRLLLTNGCAGVYGDESTPIRFAPHAVGNNCRDGGDVRIKVKVVRSSYLACSEVLAFCL